MALSARMERRSSKPRNQVCIPGAGFTHTRNINVAGELNEVTFRAVQHSAMLRAASELLNDRYAWRGYGSSHSIPSGVHHTTFTAEMGGDVVGTITLAIDSDRGLAIDQTFSDELDQIRSLEETRICELTRLAFHSSVRSKEVLAGLFHFTFIVGTTISRCTDLLIEVGPRHTSFYEAMLGFERIGPFKTNTSVGSLSQLMGLKVDAIRGNIRKFAGPTSVISSRSMYTYFLSQPEETLIRRALLASQKHADPSFGLIEGRGNVRKEGRSIPASPITVEERLLADLAGARSHKSYEVHKAA